MICTLCPRRCAAQRSETAAGGLCAMPEPPVVARAALHMWEEPPISGVRGSGSIFFSGCSLRCVFCQNAEISQGNFGKTISVARLRELMDALAAQGAHNINLVNPTHYVHAVARALERPAAVPVVWNSGGYDRVESLRAVEGKVDIYLPDLKYLDSGLAARFSGAADYPAAAVAAIREMYRQVGPVQMGEDGLLRRGVVIRHLILPGHVNEAKAVMDFVAAEFPRGSVLFSLMSQYTPFGRAKTDPALGLDRPLRRSEARAVEEYMANLGLDGFAQSGGAAAESFIPPFDLTGVEEQEMGR